MSEIEAKLDQLAEYQSQKDSIEFRKRELLDEVKVPVEVEAIVKAGMNKVASVERGYYARFDEINRDVTAQLAKIVIPEEIKIALAAVDRERALIQAYKTARENEYREQIAKDKAEIQSQFEAATAQVYEDIAQRKRDIEIEFSGKLGAVDENIEALKKEIEADVLKRGESVKGKYYHAVWNKGRVGTWNSGKLDGLALIMPSIAECRNPGGEPTVTFRSVK